MKRKQKLKKGLTVVLLTGIGGFLTMSILNIVAGLPDISGRKPSHVIGDGAQTSLGRGLAESAAQHPSESGFHELPRGLDAFAARVALIRKAERSIDAQYYMWHQDTVGRSLLHELMQAAERGVRIRLLIDDMYGSDGEKTWRAVDTHPNVEVRLFAPYSRRQPKFLQFVTRFHEVNARMHTKSFTADNQATVVGGRNIGDEYFNAGTELAFVDNDVLAVGPVVQAVSANFDAYWNGDYAYPVASLVSEGTADETATIRNETAAASSTVGAKSYFEAVSSGALARALADHTLEFRWGPAAVVHDAWWKRQKDREGWKASLLISQISPHLLAAEEELILVSPYFVPGDETVTALCRLAGAGVKVIVLTNSMASNDVLAVHAGYQKVRLPLLRAGVNLYELDEQLRADERKAFSWLRELNKSSLHAKTFIIDRKKIFVGSFNYDQRSLYLNTEIGVVFEQPEIARPAAETLLPHLERHAFKVELVDGPDGKNADLVWKAVHDGEPVSYFTEPYMGRGARFLAYLLGGLPIDWLL